MVAVVAFGCASLLLAGDQLLAKRSLDSSQAAVRDDDLASAADDARRAIALEPWASEPRLQLALVQEQAGDLAAAADSVGAAIDRNPDHWSLWLVRARVLTRLGRIAPAEDALARARGLDPRAPLFTAFPGPLAP
jgi:Flp pilus assembly protein TadD